MQTHLLIIFLVLGVTGCARLPDPGNVMYRFSQQRKLSNVVSLLEQGKTEPAAALLDSICAAPGVQGVSDEALLRLGLIRLEDGRKPEVLAQTQRDLKRLMKEYPNGSWAQMSSNLSRTLVTLEEAIKQQAKSSELNDSLREENRDLKRSNSSLLQKIRELKESQVSLTKGNAELRQYMEQLKALDLDMERKNKH